MQLVQSSVPADELLPAELSDEATPQGATELGGRAGSDTARAPGNGRWCCWNPSRTVVIVGDAAEEELAALAAALN